MISKKIKSVNVTTRHFIPIIEGGKLVEHLAIIPDTKEGEDPCIYGCTDSNAVNFDPAATCDNKTCEFQAGIGT